MDAVLVRFSVFAFEMYLSALVSEELASIVDDLFICEGGIRLLLTNAQHLPQSDSERPHVARRGELTLWSDTNTHRRSHLRYHKLHYCKSNHIVSSMLSLWICSLKFTDGIFETFHSWPVISCFYFG